MKKATTTKKPAAKATTKAKATTPKATAAPATPKAKANGPRATSKQAVLIEMLKRAGGAGLAEIMKKFGWQQHTTRAIVSQGGSLKRKHGLDVISEKNAAGERVYRIAK
jgi:cell division septation protein DedD